MSEFYLKASPALMENKKDMKSKMELHLAEAKRLNLWERAVFLGCQGSQNYDLDYAFSDVDTKLLLMPTFDELALNKSAVSTTHVLKNNEHMDLKDVRLFVPTLRKQNVNFVEMLFTDFYFVNSLYEEEWMKLVAAREQVARFSPNRTVMAMRGIACNKYKVFNNKVSEGFREDLGYDPKQVYQMGRVVEFVHRYVEGKDIYAELLKSRQRDLLLELKSGKLKYNEAVEYMNMQYVHVNNVADEYLMTNRPEDKYVDELLDEVLRNMMKIYMQEVVKYV